MAITQRGQLERDDSGFPVGYNFTYLTNATGATLIKATAGFLHGVVLNKPVATSVVTLYDCATTGTLTGTIGVITVSGTVPTFLNFDITTTTGLVVSQTTLGSDLTISFI